MWEKVTTIILITTYTFSGLFSICILLEKIQQKEVFSNMNSSISSSSPFEIPYIKNAKVVKTETKPFLLTIVYYYTQPLSFENELYSLKQFLLLENIWIHTSSVLDIDLQLSLRNIHISKLLSHNKKPPLFKHIEEQ